MQTVVLINYGKNDFNNIRNMRKNFEIYNIIKYMALHEEDDEIDELLPLTNIRINHEKNNTH